MGKTIAATCILIFISISGALYSYYTDFSSKKITSLQERNSALNYYASKALIGNDSNRASESKELRLNKTKLSFKERRYLKKFFGAFPSDAETFIELFEFNELCLRYRHSPWADHAVYIVLNRLTKEQVHKQYSLAGALNKLATVIPIRILFAKLISIGVSGVICNMDEDSHALQEFLMQSVEENEEVLKYIITNLSKKPDAEVLSFWYFFYADWHLSRYIDYYNNLAPKLPFRLSHLMGLAFWHHLREQSCCRYCGEIPKEFSVEKNPEITVCIYKQIDELISFYHSKKQSEAEKKALLVNILDRLETYLKYTAAIENIITIEIRELLKLDKGVVEKKLNSWSSHINIEDGAPAQITYFIKKLRADVTNDKNQENKK
jgi:hypothetical protein